MVIQTQARTMLNHNQIQKLNWQIAIYLTIYPDSIWENKKEN